MCSLIIIPPISKIIKNLLNNSLDIVGGKLLRVSRVPIIINKIDSTRDSTKHVKEFKKIMSNVKKFF